MSAGKGDKRRPSRVSRGEWERRWEETFGDGRPPERCGDPDCECMGPKPTRDPTDLEGLEREEFLGFSLALDPEMPRGEIELRSLDRVVRIVGLEL